MSAIRSWLSDYAEARQGASRCLGMHPLHPNSVSRSYPHEALTPPLYSSKLAFNILAEVNASFKCSGHGSGSFPSKDFLWFRDSTAMGNIFAVWRDVDQHRLALLGLLEGAGDLVSWL